MPAPIVEIADLMQDVEGFPHPRWDAVADRINSAVPPGRHDDAWADATRQWLEAVAGRIGESFAVYESDWVQLLTVRDEEFAGCLLRQADYSRAYLLEEFTEVVNFDQPGKLVVMAYPDAELYYAYVGPFHPEEGEFGGSGGMHIRAGYPHVVMYGTQVEHLRGSVAHELAHAALHHLGAPAWLEEGITQMVEQAATGRGEFYMTEEQARRHKLYWAHRVLGPFWWGTGFESPGKIQGLSYQLAEVVIRILIGEHQPGWFFGRWKRDRLVGFLKAAKAEDAGQAAAREHLGYSLGELAAKFLGPGDWEPNAVAPVATMDEENDPPPAEP
jgi:hypothetical protein